MSFLKELVQFLMARKKYWLIPIFLVMIVFGGLIVLAQGLGGRAVHLHAVLTGAARMRILGISAFYHDSAAALVVDGRDRRGRAGGALHPQEARRRLSAPCHRLLPGGGGIRSTTSTTSCSTKSRSSSSSGCSRPISRSRRAASLVPHGGAAVAAREAVPEGHAARRAEEAVEPDFDCGRAGCSSPSIT